MSFEFKLPDIGEGVSEGEIVEWHVAVGDVVAEDDPMVEVMTDKATVTIGAPRAGTIAALNTGVGEVAQVGDVIVVIATEGAAEAAPAAEEPAAAPANDEGPAATAVGDIREGLPGSSFFRTKPPAAPAANGKNGHRSNGHHAPAAPTLPAVSPPAMAGGAQAVQYFAAKPLATPATRKLARELGVDLRSIPPTGPSGRTTRKDVESYVGELSTRGAPTIAAPADDRTMVARAPSVMPTVRPGNAPAAPSLPPQPIAPPAARGGDALEERKPFVGIRRKIAQKMQTAKNTAAHFTFVEECDVTELVALRSRLAPKAAAEGVKLSYLPFIVKAVVAALKKHPVLNSALDETTNELVYRKYYDLGIAAATPSGLMVPVLRNADGHSLLGVAREIQRLGEGAREGSLGADELTGSTFTITSLGKQGGLFATPVLNHPEVGILGVHRMKERAVVKDGELAVGKVMLLSLSFDHRIVDGHVGAAFAYDIIELLEEPDRLFLAMG
ncbi:MAG: dihydrolipoamide acetyltransferase family protein [Myxococcota bacterium]